MGYIPTLPNAKPTSSDNGDAGRNDPANSIGFWLQPTNGGTATVESIVVTHKFNYPITLTQCPVPSAQGPRGRRATS